MNRNFLKKIFNLNLLQYLILFIVAVITWQIFYPGLMSPDSLAQYEQGKSGNYVDWHPPLMAMILRLVIKLGGDIGFLIFLQCLAAIFGLRVLLGQLLNFFSPNNSEQPISPLIPTGITLLFLIPFLSPHLLFSVMFWTDAWLSIALLWVVAYILWLYLNHERLNEKQFFTQVILFSISTALMILIRHNSLVMLPAISLILGLLCKIKFGKKGLIIIIFPFVLFFLFNTLIYTFFNVGKTRAGNQVLASDLTVMLRLYPEIASKYPLANRHKDSPTVLLTDNGGLWNETTEGKPCPVLDKKKCDPKMPLSCFGFKDNTFGVEGNDCYSPVGTENKALKDEYIKVVMNNPLELLGAKLYLFWQILQPDNWRTNRINCEISKNTSGLVLNDNFTGTRDKICYLNDQFANNWYFYWIFGVHLIWLILNVLLLIYFTINFFVKKVVKNFIIILLYLVPLSYYLGYILAATTSDYRFMYPSTLLMQTFVVTFLVVKIIKLGKTQKTINEEI